MKQPNETHRGPLLRKEINRLATRPVLVFAMCAYSLIFFSDAALITLERLEKSGWPTAAGTIVQGQLEFVGPSGERSVVDYERRFVYTVDDRSYASDKADLRGTTVQESSANQYQAGDAVTVYYDPERPFDAVIDPTDWPTEITKYAIGLALVIGSFFVFRKPRQRNARVTTAD